MNCRCSFDWKAFWCSMLGAAIGFVLLIILISLLSKKVHADTYKDLSKEFNLVYTEQLRDRIQHLPKKSFVEVSLKVGMIISGTFEGFQKYDDSIWILPQGKHGIFADDAYTINQLQNIRVAEPL